LLVTKARPAAFGEIGSSGILRGNLASGTVGVGRALNPTLFFKVCSSNLRFAIFETFDPLNCA